MHTRLISTANYRILPVPVGCDPYTYHHLTTFWAKCPQYTRPAHDVHDPECASRSDTVLFVQSVFALMSLCRSFARPPARPPAPRNKCCSEFQHSPHSECVRIECMPNECMFHVCRTCCIDVWLGTCTCAVFMFAICCEPCRHLTKLPIICYNLFGLEALHMCVCVCVLDRFSISHYGR